VKYQAATGGFLGMVSEEEAMGRMRAASQALSPAERYARANGILQRAQRLREQVRSDLQNQTWGTDDIQMKLYNQLSANAAFLFPNDPILSQLIVMPDKLLRSFGTILPIGSMSADLPSRRLEAQLSLMIDGLEIVLGTAPEAVRTETAAEVLNRDATEETQTIRARLEELLNRRPELPPLDQRDFAFITNPCIREVLERDYVEAQQAFIAGAFKGASVMSGGIIEAMLLDALTSPKIVALEGYAGATLRLPRVGGEINWDYVKLSQLIEASAELSILGESAMKLVDGARDFRNSLHASAECREQIRAGKEEAELLLSLVRLVYRDVQRSIR